MVLPDSVSPPHLLGTGSTGYIVEREVISRKTLNFEQWSQFVTSLLQGYVSAHFMVNRTDIGFHDFRPPETWDP